ncbi:OLC1v1033348C1 [Oldenlandia corymbosa var. corymbosa]|uniref:OLC1v1033348C1 n=1 Tax=Oldenlandia corymbosa var. corymbosa TaxID=529605 RepID=A0AAV1CR31_OLDCO|nr:OLC1v1033348C1 [Oldenlandia corymbosa var. corymbosa]
MASLHNLDGETENQDLFEELLIEIFQRLPVKTLLRLQCVCKSWLNTIQSPEFARSQLEYSSKFKPSKEKIMLQSNPGGSSSGTSQFYALESRFPDVHVDGKDIIRTLKFPSIISSENRGSSGGNFQMVGSCHGLLLLVDNLEPQTMLLWNPTTQKSRIIDPPLPISDSSSSSSSSSCINATNNAVINGFGYDPCSRDYRVVRIIPNADFSHHEILVFALKTMSWRRIVGTHGFPKSYRLVTEQTPGSIDGAIFFLAAPTHHNQNGHGSAEYVVLRFCLDSERFMGEILGAPVFDPSLYPREIQSAVFSDWGGGVPCLHWNWVCYKRKGYNYNHPSTFEVWLLEEFGRRHSNTISSSSWTRIFEQMSSLRIPRYMANRQFLFLIKGETLYFRDLSERPRYMETEVNQADPDKHCCVLSSYVESLVDV